MNRPIPEATIMIIDDEPENLRLLAGMLKRQNWMIRSFPSGPTALASAKTELPDLVLLDIRMPGMNGFEVCAGFKENEQLRGIPVIFLSAVDDAGAKVQAFQMGGADYITKPFQHDEVLARIRIQLAITHYRRELERLNLDLEDRVRQRTADLADANRQLTVEMAERQAVETALRASEERYRQIVTTANEGILTTDGRFRITYVNDVLARLFGGKPDRIVGRPAIEFIFEEDREVVHRQFEARAAGKAGRYECRMLRLEGGFRWVIVSASPLFKDDGRFGGSIVMLTDITERKQSETALKRAYEKIAELKHQIEKENIYLQEEIKLEHNFEEIVGESDEIQYTLFRVEQVAPTDAAVILLGETGTGKELIARAIHNASSRANRPLIKVNCAALAEQFIESDLFGHEIGAFTGAVKRRVGRFELAHGATIFLDEIGELPLPLQAKLLRVLQDGEFERLGDSRTLKTDARVIVATNRDLENLVDSGKFRKDLWYRIHVFPITIPPLRKRKSDIPLLANYFVKKIGKRIGKTVDKIDRKTMEELMGYDWPGNIRELEHLIERSMIVSPENNFQLAERLAPVTEAADAGQKIRTLADVERAHILRALEKTGGVIGGPHGAALLLGLKPNTLRYRMQKLDIRLPK